MHDTVRRPEVERPAMSDAYVEGIRDLTLGPLPEWGQSCVRDIMATLQSDAAPFPCVFAVAAAYGGGLRFGFVDNLYDETTWSALSDILANYLAVYQDISRNTSLVVFFGSGGGAAGGRVDEVLDYEQRFWSVLRYLNQSDEQPWPVDIPTDPDTSTWEFVFRGTPIFVVCNTPGHRRLRSRSNPVFTITFQPRWVFEGLEPDTPRGATARKIIRARLKEMDEVDSTPLLGSYGDPANREWKQYFLRDDASVPARCPFRGKAAAAAENTPEPAWPPAVTIRPVAGQFKVVVNSDEQYSVWPAGRRNALGWFDTDVVGTREQCLDDIELRWTDMRPRSLRRRMAARAGQCPAVGAARYAKPGRRPVEARSA